MFRGLSSVRVPIALASLALVATLARAQTPQPFPRPQPAPPPPAPGSPASPGTLTKGEAAPTEKTLGVPIYPSAQYLGSYDAGRGQRFHLFGVASNFSEMVAYYRTTLKQRGEVLFETPPTHMFETGRYREETMAFPPSVTVKDYTWGGSAGLPNPRAGSAPSHFPTVLQIVAAPAGSPQ
jgi:hypothetical protein